MNKTSLEHRIRSLLCTNRVHPIDISSFDYIEGLTKDEDINKEDSFIVRGCRFYENPFFWNLIYTSSISSGFGRKVLAELQSFLQDPMDPYDIVNQQVLEMLMDQNIYSASKVKTMIETHLKYEDRTKYDLARLAMLAVGNKSDKYFYVIHNFGYEDPDGQVFIEACRLNKELIINFLLENDKIDPSIHESMGFLLLVKHGDYTMALKLLDKGADIHAVNDLGYKSFLINDGKRFCKKGEEAAHNEIMMKFKSNNCLKETVTQEKEN